MTINSRIYPHSYSGYIKTCPSGGFLCLFIILMFFLSSCAISKDNVGTGMAHLIRNVPFFPQETYQCGPASLAEVMLYWGVKTSPESISKEIYSNSARGTLTLDMVLYAQKKGLNAIHTNKNRNISYIRENINNGYPLIVMVDYGFWKYQQYHYMVIIGYNNNGIIAYSGKSPQKFINEEDFLRIWGKANSWTLLITPKQSKKQ